MWEIIGAGISLIRILFGYLVTKTHTREDLTNASKAFAVAKASINQSASDREDVKAQKERLDQITNPPNVDS